MNDEPLCGAWLPISVAVFRLQYEVSTNRGTRRGFLSESLAARSDTSGALTYDPRLADGSGGLLTKAAVDFESGQFVYEWTTPSGLQKKLQARPWTLPGSSPPYDLSEAAWEHLVERGSQVWLQLMADFSRQVEAGAVVVAGRPGSVFAEAREIPADSWPAVAVEDWEIGAALASSGERLLGLRARLRSEMRAHADHRFVGPAGAQIPAAKQSAEKLGGRPARQRRRVFSALERAYPGGPSTWAELSNDDLYADVLKHLDSPAHQPSRDTILRAAGRKR